LNADITETASSVALVPEATTFSPSTSGKIQPRRDIGRPFYEEISGVKKEDETNDKESNGGK
jgi:hypothetical protein